MEEKGPNHVARGVRVGCENDLLRDERIGIGLQRGVFFPDITHRSLCFTDSYEYRFVSTTIDPRAHSCESFSSSCSLDFPSHTPFREKVLAEGRVMNLTTKKKKKFVGWVEID